MFTDIVNYTKLMGEDEKMALQTLKKNRDIHQKILDRFGGLFIKELGDGVLATFHSATDAVLAAASLKIAVANETKYHLRIGIHLSEVVFENDDVFGDGVNIAARIQASADPDTILVSDYVQKNLANKKGITTKPFGNLNLKNVRDEITVHEVQIEDDYEGYDIYRTPVATTLNHQMNHSIAVLPFRNMGTNHDDEYLSDGIAEEILISLSNVENLKVIGRTSAFQYKKSTLPAQEIAKALGVTTILDGSLRRTGSFIRINATLINAADGSQIWADRYDREIKDIFLIQEDIASKISKKLQLTFTSPENKLPPINIEAYEYLLKGRYYVEHFIDGFDKAHACFSRAIELDNNYAEAYAEMAKLYFLYTMQLYYKPHEGFARAKYYGERALLLNSELGGAHYVLGQVYFWYSWDFAKSIKQFLLAEQSKVSFYFRGVVVDPWVTAFGYGDFDSAIAGILKVLDKDPFSIYSQIHLIFFNMYGRYFEQAHGVADAILKVVPDLTEVVRLKAYCYFFEKRYEEALEWGAKADTLSKGVGWSPITYTLILAAAGQQEEAQKRLAELKKTKAHTQGSPLGLALIHTYLGEWDEAFVLFESALDYHDIWMVSLKYGLEYDPIRQDPRFEALLDKIGFPEAKGNALQALMAQSMN